MIDLESFIARGWFSIQFRRQWNKLRITMIRWY